MPWLNDRYIRYVDAWESLVTRSLHHSLGRFFSREPNHMLANGSMLATEPPVERSRRFFCHYLILTHSFLFIPPTPNIPLLGLFARCHSTGTNYPATSPPPLHLFLAHREDGGYLFFLHLATLSFLPASLSVWLLRQVSIYQCPSMPALYWLFTCSQQVESSVWMRSRGLPLRRNCRPISKWRYSFIQCLRMWIWRTVLICLDHRLRSHRSGMPSDSLCSGYKHVSRKLISILDRFICGFWTRDFKLYWLSTRRWLVPAEKVCHRFPTFFQLSWLSFPRSSCRSRLAFVNIICCLRYIRYPCIMCKFKIHRKPTLTPAFCQ